MGAWSAHGLEAVAGARGVALVDTAVRFQLWHVLAMLAALALYRQTRAAPFVRAAQLFTAGILLFCGALYVLAFGGPRWPGMVPPLGGLAMIAGWLALAWGGVRAFPRDGAAG
ncbi:MAG: DUF423 domain-containing protein [Rhodospirillales bacterium]|nr:MAG: DUF423 domain-containing protein [Rhodospirillales bacterium]